MTAGEHTHGDRWGVQVPDYLRGRGLTPIAKQLYGEFLFRTRQGRTSCTVGYRTLARQLECRFDTLADAIAQLEQARLLSVDGPRKGSGRRNTYRVHTPESAPESEAPLNTESAADSEALDSTEALRNPERSRSGNRSASATESGARKKEKEKHEHGEAYASQLGEGEAPLHIAEPNTDAVRDELAALGIKGPKLGQLAGTDGVTVELIRDIAGRASAQGLRAGWIVQELERRAPDNAGAIRRQAARERHEMERRAEVARDRREIEASKKRVKAARATVAAADPVSVDRLFKTWIEDNPTMGNYVKEATHTVCVCWIAKQLQADTEPAEGPEPKRATG